MSRRREGARHDELDDVLVPPAELGRPPFARPAVADGLSDWLTTTDHKKIGLLYIGTAFALFGVGGIIALLMRLELAQPGLQLMPHETYNELFTMHGTIMMLLFGTPMAAGFANYLVPLQIGAADMAFPRFNALSYWLFLFGALIVLASLLTVGGGPDAGWTGYPPLSTRSFSPGAGMDMWIVGLMLTGFASIFGAINFITTIFTRRAPGMTMLRMPILTWAILVTATLILFAFPSLTAALAMLYVDRHFGGAFFNPATGGDPIVYQHLFWFFGHPEVYILILPFFGVISEVIPVFSRKPLFGYRLMIFSLVLIAVYSFSVWAHHMYTTGAVDLPFFAIMSFLIAVPTGVKFFNWIATMWRGQLTFPAPMVWAMGMLYVFLIGGITGVIIASPPLDFHVHDTYFIVGHMHNVMVGGTAFAMFAGFYFWFPKATGRMLSERLAKLHFWLFVVGFSVTFIPQHQLGVEGMPRRFADYPANPGWPELNLVSTLGSFAMGLGGLVFLLAVLVALRKPPDAPDDPWGANSLEWATSSPPPHHNFRWLPPIHSERPLWDERMRRAGLPEHTTERDELPYA